MSAVIAADVVLERAEVGNELQAPLVALVRALDQALWMIRTQQAPRS
jgi:hypothetical protein